MVVLQLLVLFNTENQSIRWQKVLKTQRPSNMEQSIASKPKQTICLRGPKTGGALVGKKLKSSNQKHRPTDSSSTRPAHCTSTTPHLACLGRLSAAGGFSRKASACLGRFKNRALGGPFARASWLWVKTVLVPFWGR